MKQNHQKEKHELGHHLVHEENHKKTNMIWCTKKTTKKHDLVHEERRFGARRKPEKNTIWCTKKTRKKHDSVHEENQKKARFGARRKPRRKLNFLVLHLKHV